MDNFKEIQTDKEDSSDLDQCRKAISAYLESQHEFPEQ